MNQLIRFGLVLGVTCLVATLVLAGTYELTKPAIDEQARREETAALRALVPEATAFTPKRLENSDYFDALKNGVLVGYCIKMTAPGYGGYIRLIVGIDPAGIIKGIRVLEHQETPGLGARINEVRPGESDPWFLRQFAGKDARSLTLRKNIDAITGATISSAAVTDAVRAGVSAFLARVQK